MAESDSSRVYDSCHLQADCQELGSAPEPYARQSSMGNLYFFYLTRWNIPLSLVGVEVVIPEHELFT